MDYLEFAVKEKPDLTGCYDDDFWYNLTLGGYIRPENILADDNQTKMLNQAIKLVRDFEQCVDELVYQRMRKNENFRGNQR